MEHSIVVERVPHRVRVRYGVEEGDFLPATVAMTHPTNKFRRVMRPLAPCPA